MNGAIAIIDDTDISLELTEHNLAAAGYRSVATFKDPWAALEEIRQGHIPKLIITDFQMPGMNGLELLNRAIDLNPGIRGLIITGCPELVGDTKGRFPVIGKGEKDFLQSLLQHVIAMVPPREAQWSA